MPADSSTQRKTALGALGRVCALAGLWLVLLCVSLIRKLLKPAATWAADVEDAVIRKIEEL